MKQNHSLKKRFPIQIDELKEIIQEKFKENPEDLLFSIYTHKKNRVAIFCVPYLIDTNKYENHILGTILKKQKAWTNDIILNEIPIGDGTTTSSIQEVINQLINGDIFIYIENELEIISYSIPKPEKRQVEKPEIETVILGPKIAFTELLSTNLNILRQTIKSTDLVMEKITIGNEYENEVRLIYLNSITNETDIKTLRKRLENLDVDEVGNISILKQYIEDSSTNLFPQFYTTELPDRLSYVIKQGKIGVLMDGSSEAIITPSTFWSFLESSEDLYMRWQVGSVLRILRMMAMFISFSVTSIYVAVVSYHYELIPTELLISLGQSRATVPYPPIIEALIIEFLVELLREAGARLPSKIGQTIGIVGGIIVGESAVQAGLTSNILIIVVAMSALASYSTPNYLMATSLRLIRFPMILLAAFYGIVGIMFGFCFIIIHLLRLTSLDRPYLSPLYPLNLQDLNKVFYHLPRQFQSKRARLTQPKKLDHYSKRKASQKKDIDK